MEVSLKTTRRDQARAQFSFLGHSICGDYRYGPLADMKSLGSSAPSALYGTAEEGGGMINENLSERRVAQHDPLRRLGLHFSELRLTHPATNSALTLTSNCPTSFTDLMRRSPGNSRASLTKFKNSGNGVSSITETGGDSQADSIVQNRFATDGTQQSDGQTNIRGSLSVVDEDGQMDSLRSGSSQYAADSASSSMEKVKVFTLSEFLGPGKARGGSNRSDGRGREDQQGPPPSSKTVYRRK